MSYLIQAWLDLFAAQGAVGIVKVVVMWVLGGVLIFLAIKKDMEPALLLPIGFGAILVNIPGTSVLTDGDGHYFVAVRSRHRSFGGYADTAVYRHRRDD